MGVLSDLVVATDANVERIGQSQVPSKDFSGIDGSVAANGWMKLAARRRAHV